MLEKFDESKARFVYWGLTESGQVGTTDRRKIESKVGRQTHELRSELQEPIPPFNTTPQPDVPEMALLMLVRIIAWQPRTFPCLS